MLVSLFTSHLRPPESLNTALYPEPVVVLCYDPKQAPRMYTLPTTSTPFCLSLLVCCACDAHPRSWPPGIIKGSVRRRTSLAIPASLLHRLILMSHPRQGSKLTVFSRDTGQTSQDGRKLDPFAAVRHLNAARAAASSPSVSGLSKSSTNPTPTPHRAERRPLEPGDQKPADSPPAKKARVNNTIVSLCSQFDSARF